MNTKFIISLLVILNLFIGLPSVFAQSNSIITETTKYDKVREYQTEVSTIAKLIVEVKPRHGNDTLFVYRAMELVVTPIDIYDNEIIDMENEIAINFTAGYPDEFLGIDNSDSSLFSGSKFIKGKTNYILTPTEVRDDQWIRAYIYDDPSIFGESNSFKIVAHAPSAFTLTVPPSGAEVLLNYPNLRIDFRWTPATDPNDKPLIMTVPLAEGKVVPDTVYDNDFVKYSFKVKELNNWIFPDDKDTDEVLTVTGTMLMDIYQALGYGEAYRSCPVNWYVVATDGLFETLSNSHILTITIWDWEIYAPELLEIPDKFAVGQNYPNPFNPTTNIQYDIPKTSDVKIVIYNILGQPIKTLVDARQEAARYNVTWDGKNDKGEPVASGIYIYKVTAGEFSASKKMNLLK